MKKFKFIFTFLFCIMAIGTFYGCGQKVELSFNQQIIENIKDKIVDKELVINNTICSATDLRQKETKEMATKVDVQTPFYAEMGGESSYHRILRIGARWRPQDSRHTHND